MCSFAHSLQTSAEETKKKKEREEGEEKRYLNEIRWDFFFP